MNIYSLLHCQYEQVKAGGLKVLYNKLWKVVLKIGFCLQFLGVLPLVVIIRIIRPVKLIRFNILLSSRIGHFAIETELYLCEREVGIQDRSAFDLFYYEWRICNDVLSEKWKEKIRIYQWIKLVDRLNRMLPGFEPHIVPLASNLHADPHGLLNQIPAHIEFTCEEEQIGKNRLASWGINGDLPFVCIHARDSAYLKNVVSGDLDWQYHDYRDTDIQNYRSAAEELDERGYYSVRMGVQVHQGLETSSAKLIDYAMMDHDPFLDLYLSAKCSFMIVTNSGFNGLGILFRKPMAFVNVVPFLGATITCNGALFIPKKYWLKEEKRYMTFSEIVTTGAGDFSRTEEFLERGIELVENTPEEIKNIVIEMDGRLNDTWEPTSEDDELQAAFQEIVNPFMPKGVRLPCICADFLRRHRGLLK